MNLQEIFASERRKIQRHYEDTITRFERLEEFLRTDKRFVRNEVEPLTVKSSKCFSTPDEVEHITSSCNDQTTLDIIVLCTLNSNIILNRETLETVNILDKHDASWKENSCNEHLLSCRGSKCVHLGKVGKYYITMVGDRIILLVERKDPLLFLHNNIWYECRRDGIYHCTSGDAVHTYSNGVPKLVYYTKNRLLMTLDDNNSFSGNTVIAFHFE
jgi:hypothetical protein